MENERLFFERINGDGTQFAVKTNSWEASDEPTSQKNKTRGFKRHKLLWV